MKRTTPQRRGDQRRGDQRRRSRSDQPATIDIWRTPRPLPELQPIVTAPDPTALLASLGEPPLPGGTEVGRYFDSVIERSAAIATALALSADLLATPRADDLP